MHLRKFDTMHIWASTKSQQELIKKRTHFALCLHDFFVAAFENPADLLILVQMYVRAIHPNAYPSAVSSGHLSINQTFL